MNDEVKKIKEGKEYKEPRFLNDRNERDEIKKELCIKLNTNMNVFYVKDDNVLSLNGYVEAVIQNIYLILDYFAKVNIYPDGFFRIFREFKSDVLSNKDGVSTARIDFYKKIKDEFRALRRKKENDLTQDIGNVYDEMVEFYHVHNLDCGNYYQDIVKAYQESNSHNNSQELNSKKNYLSNKSFKTGFITEEFMITDGTDEDIECLMSLMYEYMSFLVEVGVNPKERLDEIIEENKEVKRII